MASLCTGDPAWPCLNDGCLTLSLCSKLRFPEEDLIFPAWMKCPLQACSAAGVEGDTRLVGRQGEHVRGKNNWHFNTDGSYSPCFADRETDSKTTGTCRDLAVGELWVWDPHLSCWMLSSPALPQWPSQSSSVACRPLTSARMTGAGNRS